MSKYISSKEATKLLGINRNSLYAYVSRGIIKTINDPKNRKRRMYSSYDIDKLLMRKQKPEKITQSSLNWGTSILKSKITLIQDNKLFYRGIEVASLIKSWSFEEVCSLVITGSKDKIFDLLDFSKPELESIKKGIKNLRDMQELLIILELNSISSSNYRDHRRNQSEKLGFEILFTLISALTKDYSNKSISSKLASYFCIPDQFIIANELINTALILLADHELNSSSFTARNVASTGSSIHQCIIAGISSFLGFKHGSSVYNIEAMVNELQIDFEFEKNLRKWIPRPIYGFGHNLYPEGDQRADLLLSEIQKSFIGSRKFETLMKINRVCTKFSGYKPNIDFALLVLSRVLEQSIEFSQIIFAIGRISGWIGHIIEQYEEDTLIRPRAKYIGVKPKL